MQREVRLSEKQTYPALILLLLAGTFLRLARLDVPSLWLDEAMSVNVAAQDWAGLLRSARDYFGGLAYFLQLHLWLSCFGQDEFVLRLPSALLSILSLPILYQTARRFLDQRKALLAVLLLTVAPLDIWYAQEARMYSQASFLGLLCVYGYLHFRETGAATFALIYAIAGLAGTYTLYSFPLILLAVNIHFALTSFWYRYPRRRWIPWLLAQLGIVVGFLPWLPIFRHHLQLVASNVRAWQTLAALFQFLARWGISAEQARRYSFFLIIPAAVGFISLMIWGKGWTATIRRWLDRPWMACLWGVLPYIGLTILAAWRPASSIRQLTIGQPYLAIVASAALSRIRRGRSMLLFALIAVAMVCTIKNYWTPKEQWREAARLVAEAEQPGDAIVYHAYYAKPAFEYYYRGKSFRKGATKFRDVGPWRELKRNYRRIWLVLSHEIYEDPTEELQKWFDQNTSFVEERRLVGIRIRLYETGGAPSPSPLSRTERGDDDHRPVS